MSHSKVLRVAIVGFGDRGVSMLSSVLEQSVENRIVAVVDPCLERSRFFLEECVARQEISPQEASRITFYASLVDLPRDSYDVLLLTASEQVRTRMFAQTVATGAHLYMEKGLSNTLQGGRQIAQAVRRRGRGQKIFMGFNYRYFPMAMEARRLVEEGAIGRPRFVHYIEMLNQGHGSSFFRRWHRDASVSGGMIVTKGCHDLDFMAHVIHARPRFVSCTQSRQMFGQGGPQARQQCVDCDRRDHCAFDQRRFLRTRQAIQRHGRLYTDEHNVSTDGYTRNACVWKTSDLHDTTSILIEYDSGCTGSFSQVLYAPVSNRVMTCFGDQGAMFYDERSRQIIVKDIMNQRTATFTDFPTRGSHGGSDINIAHAFFDCIRHDTPEPVTIDDGLWSLAIAFAAYESADTGQRVNVAGFFDKMMTADPTHAHGQDTTSSDATLPDNPLTVKA